MYPDWPRSSADLVPLPRCDGPKLKPFDFQGPQAINFLDFLGEGLHSLVFKVEMHGQIYALKLFRFSDDSDWLSPARGSDQQDRELMSAFYDYAEPFSCECRAFGRLQEAGHEELAVDCFGYVLLDEDHESALCSRFPEIDFTGDVYIAGIEDIRSRFLGRDGRPPPLRGIVKEFRQPSDEEELRAAEARKMLDDIKRLQQLGIFSLDVAARQLVGGKIADFSMAITVPHFVTSPELNPGLTREMRILQERETFRLSKEDYLAFDEMISEWNLEFADKKGAITVQAFPGGNGSPPLRYYQLRNKVERQPVFTYVDPRRYNWKWSRKGCRRKLRAKPPMWLYKCGEDSRLAASLRESEATGLNPMWHYRDGMIFPGV